MRSSTIGIVASAVLVLIPLQHRAASADAFVPSTQPAAASPEDQVTENSLKRTMPQFHLPGVKLSDGISFLRDISGMNLYVDWANLKLASVTPDTSVAVDQANTTTGECISKTLAATGSDALQYRVANGVIFISTKLDFEDRKKKVGPYLANLSDPTSASPVLNKRMASVQLPPLPLSDAISFIRDISGATIEVKWGPLVAAGIQTTTPVSLQLQGARMETILNLLLDQVGEGKLGFTATPVTIKRFDKKRGNVTVKTALITISTIDDLTKSAATQRLDNANGRP
jgi:hypothetical protein